MHIGMSQDALYPECRFKCHTVAHIFSCDAVPRSLKVHIFSISHYVGWSVGLSVGLSVPLV